MNRSWFFAIVPAGCAAGCFVATFAFFMTLLLVKLLWAWTVPDLFPRAVEEGYVASTISWFSAFKISVFVAVLAGIAGARRSNA